MGRMALAELGWDEARDDIVLVEWPDRLGALRPARCADHALPSRHRSTQRRAVLSGWPDRLGRIA